MLELSLSFLELKVIVTALGAQWGLRGATPVIPDIGCQRWEEPRNHMWEPMGITSLYLTSTLKVFGWAMMCI